jgi:hypothetical protein
LAYAKPRQIPMFPLNVARLLLLCRRNLLNVVRSPVYNESCLTRAVSIGHHQLSLSIDDVLLILNLYWNSFGSLWYYRTRRRKHHKGCDVRFNFDEYDASLTSFFAKRQYSRFMSRSVCLIETPMPVECSSVTLIDSCEICSQVNSFDARQDIISSIVQWQVSNTWVFERTRASLPCQHQTNFDGCVAQIFNVPKKRSDGKRCILVRVTIETK